MKVILGIIIVVFVLYFGSTRGRQKADSIAALDNKTISYVEYQREYERLLDAYRERFQGALTDEVLKQLNLKQQAYDDLINQAVMMQKAEDMKIQVSDEEVKNMILSYPAFQRGGAFDQRIYEELLRYNKMTPEEFEAAQRKNLTIGRLSQLIQEGMHVSDREVLDVYRAQADKINAEFITFAARDFRARLSPTDADLEGYLKTHGDEFRVPEQIKVSYIVFPGGAYGSGSKVTEAEIADYYDRHRDRFLQGGKTLSLNQVRGKIASEMQQIGGMYRAGDEAKRAHDTIYQEENFDAYAAKNKLAVHTTDYFTSRNIPAEFKGLKEFSTFFSLDKNEIGQVLSSDSAYYVVKVVDKKAPYVPLLKDVRAEVERRYLDAESRSRCRSAAEAAFAALKKGGSFTALAAKQGLQIQETGFFLPAGPAPKLGASRQIQEAMFQISDKSPYPEGPLNMGDDSVIIRFKALEPASVADFEAKKQALKLALLRMKRATAVSSWLKDTKAALIKDGRLKIYKEVKDL